MLELWRGQGERHLWSSGDYLFYLVNWWHLWLERRAIGGGVICVRLYRCIHTRGIQVFRSCVMKTRWNWLIWSWITLLQFRLQHFLIDWLVLRLFVTDRRGERDWEELWCKFWGWDMQQETGSLGNSFGWVKLLSSFYWLALNLITTVVSSSTGGDFQSNNSPSTVLWGGEDVCPDPVSCALDE